MVTSTKETGAARKIDFSDDVTGLFEENDEDDSDNDSTELDDEDYINKKYPIQGDNWIPKIGMEFDSEPEAYAFYNRYAKLLGFSVRREKAHKTKTKIILDRQFVCSCQGTRKPDKRGKIIKKPRRETRFNCLAELKVSCRLTGKYRVYEFVPEHTHVLASPRKAHLLRSHRKIEEAQKIEIEMMDKAGIKPREGITFMASQVGGRENVGFIDVDHRNYLRSKRHQSIKLGDTGGILEYLQKMQVSDPSFFYAIQVDEDDLITNIFWADARMIMDYAYFGDVVCFDTTYKKFKECRPFGLFVGVNHHRQTTIFGAALLFDETADTFKWLFDSFAEAMSGKKPKTILTDQDAAMAKALASQWPDTNHRLCVWHIYQNAAKHLHDIFAKHKTFARDFSSCVYDHDEEDDFFNAWESMLAEYDLKDNEWLRGLFELKEKWALVYGRHMFCAAMSTTQRSESMNSHIKRYIDYKYDMRRFFEHFQRLVEDRRYKELTADFKSNQTAPVLKVPVGILKQVGEVYTHEMFELFNTELWKAWDCYVEKKEEDEMTRSYTVVEKHHKHIVTHMVSGEQTECSCKKFQFVGILCSHVLKVFSLENIHKVPDKYILKRWTKKAKDGCSRVVPESTVSTDPKVNIAIRYKELCWMFTQLAAKAAKSEATYKDAIGGHATILEQIEGKLKTITVNEGDQKTNTTQPTSIIKGLKVRGVKVKHKTADDKGPKRKKSALEKLTTRKKRVGKKDKLVEQHSKDDPFQELPLQTSQDICSQHIGLTEEQLGIFDVD